MAWVEFHATSIIKRKKFHDLRVWMGWSVAECLGNLGIFWGHTLEVQEDGNVTGWDAGYVAGVLSFGAQVSERFLEGLKTYRWIDPVNANGQELIHDWLDYAGTFLRGKYSGNRDKLVQIWALHGRIYGKPIGNPSVTDREPIGNPQETKRTLPNLTRPKAKPPNPLSGFEVFWQAYPRRTARKKAEDAWRKLSPDDGLRSKIDMAIKAQMKTDQWKKNGGEFIPHPATWLSQRRWEDELAPTVVSAPAADAKALKAIRRASRISECCGKPLHEGKPGNWHCSSCNVSQTWYKP